MKVVLLSAGLGTRLRPLTNFMPKCLVPVHGVPLLQYWIEMFDASNTSEVFVNRHYYSDLVEGYLGTLQTDFPLTQVYEEQLLGTGGTLKKVANSLLGEPTMVVHADNLSLFSVNDFYQAHLNRPAGTEMTMMLFETPTPQSCGIVERDDSGVVQKFHEKVKNPPGNLANAAVYIFEPSVIEYIKSRENSFVDISTEVLPEYLGKINTYVNKDYHRDIGEFDSLVLAQAEFNQSTDVPGFQGEPKAYWNKFVNELWPQLKVSLDNQNVIFCENEEEALAVQPSEAICFFKEKPDDSKLAGVKLKTLVMS